MPKIPEEPINPINPLPVLENGDLKIKISRGNVIFVASFQGKILIFSKLNGLKPVFTFIQEGEEYAEDVELNFNLIPLDPSVK
jgi:hypothetical protein